MILKATEPIRIIHVFGILNRGGAESMIMNFYRRIDREKYQFDFIVHGKEEGVFEQEILKMGGRIYRVPTYKIYNHFSYKNQWKKLLSEIKDSDIVHSHIRSTASLFLPIAKSLDYKIIIHSHNTSVGNGFKAIIKSLLQKNIGKSGEKLVSCGEEAGNWLFKDKKFEIIPNSIPTELYKFDIETRIKMREELGLLKEKTFVNVGRFHNQKNHLFLLKIFKEIIKVDSNCVLYLIGDGELRPKIEAEISKLSLQNHVKMLGVRGDVPKVLQAMDVMIMPSIHEGLPVTLIEAQASGLNIFASANITTELNVTETINYISLDKNEREWAKIILDNCSTMNRLLLNDIVNKTKYEVDNGIMELIKIYNNI